MTPAPCCGYRRRQVVVAATYPPLKRFVRSELFVRPAENSDYICQGANTVLGRPLQAAAVVSVSVLGAPQTGQYRAAAADRRSLLDRPRLFAG